MFHFSIDVNNILLTDILHQILTSLGNVFELFIFDTVEFPKNEVSN